MIHRLVLDEEEGTVTFQVRGYDGDFNLFVSESYPTGESRVYGPDDWEARYSGRLGSVLDAVLKDVGAKLAKRASSRLRDCASGDGVSNVDETNSYLHDHDEQLDDTLDSDWIAPHSPPIIMEEAPMESTLQRHLHNVKHLLGAKSIDYTQGADYWRVRMRVDLVVGVGAQAHSALLDETTARAWGAATDKPIGLELQLPVKNYLSQQSMPARIVTAVWQEGFEKFQLGKQILQILTDFCDVLLQRNTSGHCGPDTDRDIEATEVMSQYSAKKDSMMIAARGDRDAGLFVHIVNYLRLRLVTLHEYCAICDQPFTMPPMFMRTVCTRYLCAYQFVEFGDRITTAEGVNAQAEVSDLLICMFARAVLSARHELITDPYPCVSADRDSKELTFNPKKKDFKKLAKAVSDLMTLRDGNSTALGAAWTALSRKMSKEGQALVQWVVASNRSYLAPLQENEAIQAFKTPFQYLLISAPPDREKRFQALKLQHGSVFAFHGSGSENWHSILRNGLKNCSNTKYMTAGAAHGPGIYLAPDSGTSLGYSMRGAQVPGGPPQPIKRAIPSSGPLKRQDVGNRCLEGMETLFMLAVCEVIAHSSLQKHRNGQIWVMPNEEMVLTRFFIVFTQSHPPTRNISITGLETEIRQCMEKLRVGSVGDSGAGG
jgi:poly [ADP-ribose] polymerase 6/8